MSVPVAGAMGAGSRDGKSRVRRLAEIGAWLLGIAIVVVILDLLGVDVTGWFSDLWHQIKAIPAGYVVAGVVAQSLQTVFAGLSYYGILSAAYPGEVTIAPIVTAYAVGVADEQLPARQHRHVRHARDVRRDHPERAPSAAPSPPTSCRRSSSRSPARSSTSISSFPYRARSRSTSATSRSIPDSRCSSSSEAGS